MSMTKRSRPKAKPPCGGAPKFQGVQEEAKLFARFFFADAQGFEHRRLDFGVVDTNGATADFDAVEHQVVAQALTGAGSLFSSSTCSG